VTLTPPTGRGATLKPKITEVKAGETLEWLGHVGIAGLFDGRHRFQLEPNEHGGTTVTHSETFTGVLVPLFARALDTHTLAGFHMMNEALKARAEQDAGPPRPERGAPARVSRLMGSG
jgi:hypothetical protein